MDVEHLRVCSCVLSSELWQHILCVGSVWIKFVPSMLSQIEIWSFFLIFFIFILVHIDALGFIICSFWSVECGGVFVLLAYTRVHQGELLASEVVWSHWITNWIFASNANLYKIWQKWVSPRPTSAVIVHANYRQDLQRKSQGRFWCSNLFAINLTWLQTANTCDQSGNTHFSWATSGCKGSPTGLETLCLSFSPLWVVSNDKSDVTSAGVSRPLVLFQLVAHLS